VRSSRKIVVVILTIAFFAYTAVSGPSHAQPPTSVNLTQANSAIGGAFVAVYNAATKDFANVAGLVSRLNNATQLVNEAIATNATNPSQASGELLAAHSMAQLVKNQTRTVSLVGSAAHHVFVYTSLAESLEVIAVAASLYLLSVFVYDKWWYHNYSGYRVLLRKRGFEAVDEISSSSSTRTPIFPFSRSAKRKVAAGGLALIALVIAFALLQPFYSPFPNTQKDTQFAVLGPNKIAEGYPTKVALNQQFQLYGYLSNQEGTPQYYHVLIKEAGPRINFNSTASANAPVVAQYYFVLDNRQNRTFPMSLMANAVGTQIMIFEIWAYRPTDSGWSFTYTGVFNQIWLNVTNARPK
jgi:hypothetical protein